MRGRARNKELSKCRFQISKSSAKSQFLGKDSISKLHLQKDFFSCFLIIFTFQFPIAKNKQKNPTQLMKARYNILGKL